MILLISYDLNGHERPSAYQDVKAVIEQNATDSIKALYSQWFVQTNESPDVWSERIKTVADASDRWFVCEVRRPCQGWLNKDVWEWLDARV